MSCPSLSWRQVHQQRRHGRRTLSCAYDDDNMWKTRHSSTPVTPGDATAEKLVDKTAWEEKLKSAKGKRTIFPWRHEVEPLERLVDPNIQGGLLGPGIAPMPWFMKHLFTLVSAVHLNIPWYSVFLDSKWKQELADASGFAFSQAVAGVLSNTYKSE